MTLTFIVPALHFHPCLEKTIKDFTSKDALDIFGSVRFVIVGSVRDKNLQRLQRSYPNIDIVESPKGGRGAALAKGAEKVSDGWVLFLHADTYLKGDYFSEILEFMNRENNESKAGYFRFRQDEGRLKVWALERLVDLRNRVLALPYGDQGLLIHKNLYDQVGGFRRDHPLMEDVDFIRRLGRKRLHRFKSFSVTSAERYKDGYMRRILTNAKCLSLYFRGKDVREIAKIYTKTN